MILPIVPRAEQRTGFGDQLLIGREILCIHGQVRFFVGDEIHDVGWSFSGLGQFDLPVMQTRDQRRIDQGGERNLVELNRIAVSAGTGQCRAEFPAGRQGYGRRKQNVIGARVLRIKHDGIPIQVENIAGRGRAASRRRCLAR